ncbi:Uncharacterized protein dnm_058610 [Desulfonema magnum]|uniref:Uncharacterized protein n=1 Tax=Desulfonema magnum TaxID=45655 RepID=A0A975GQE6_9BACT|nr:Uncharacterized protein dnm_058610 [Desulfonema magnum]
MKIVRSSANKLPGYFQHTEKVRSSAKFIVPPLGGVTPPKGGTTN